RLSRKSLRSRREQPPMTYKSEPAGREERETSAKSTEMMAKTLGLLTPVHCWPAAEMAAQAETLLAQEQAGPVERQEDLQTLPMRAERAATARQHQAQVAVVVL